MKTTNVSVLCTTTAVPSTIITLYCWGKAGPGGAIGDGTTSDRNSPTAVDTTPFGGAKEFGMSAPVTHTCAVHRWKCGVGVTTPREPLAITAPRIELQQSRSQVSGALLAPPNPTGASTVQAPDAASKMMACSTAGVTMWTPNWETAPPPNAMCPQLLWEGLSLRMCMWVQDTLAAPPWKGWVFAGVRILTPNSETAPPHSVLLLSPSIIAKCGRIFPGLASYPPVVSPTMM